MAAEKLPYRQPCYARLEVLSVAGASSFNSCESSEGLAQHLPYPRPYVRPRPPDVDIGQNASLGQLVESYWIPDDRSRIQTVSRQGRSTTKDAASL